MLTPHYALVAILTYSDILEASLIGRFAELWETSCDFVDVEHPARVRLSDQPMPLLQARGIPGVARIARPMDGHARSGANGFGKTFGLGIAPTQAPSTLHLHSTEDKKLVPWPNCRGCAAPAIGGDAALERKIRRDLSGGYTAP